MKIINKLLWYALFYASSTLFVYFLINAGMAFTNIKDPNSITTDFVATKAFLPFLYVSLLLVIMVITQTKILKTEEKAEEKIYACFNMIFSLLESALGIILVSLSIPKGFSTLVVVGSMILGLGIIELAYSIYLFIDSSKRKEIEQENNIQENHD